MLFEGFRAQMPGAGLKFSNGTLQTGVATGKATPLLEKLNFDRVLKAKAEARLMRRGSYAAARDDHDQEPLERFYD